MCIDKGLGVIGTQKVAAPHCRNLVNNKVFDIRDPKACCLITGMSATARKRKEEVAQALKKLIQSKGKTPAMKYQQLLDDLRGQSETVNILFCLSLYPQ